MSTIVCELFKIAPFLFTLKSLYLLCERPLLFGFAMFTRGVPFGAEITLVLPSAATIPSARRGFMANSREIELARICLIVFFIKIAIP